MNAKRVSAEALTCKRTYLHARSISMKAGSASRSAKVDMLRRVSPKLGRCPVRKHGELHFLNSYIFFRVKGDDESLFLNHRI